MWDFYGRVDDLIILSNGHNVNAIAMETDVQGHPLVCGALVIGTGRPHPAIMIELAEEANGQSRDLIMESIWPTIEIANRSIPGYDKKSLNMALASAVVSSAGSGAE